MSAIGKAMSAAKTAKKAGEGAKSAFELDGTRLLFLLAGGSVIGFFLFVLATLLLVIIIVVILVAATNSQSTDDAPKPAESQVGQSVHNRALS